MVEGLSLADQKMLKSSRAYSKLFAHCLRSMKHEEEFLKAKQSLGFAPKSINLEFCDDSFMRQVQKKFRKLDRTTDILSFPSLELELLEQENLDASLGDLLVSVPAIVRGARRGRRSFEQELTEVLVHGFLHLLGLDHIRNRTKAKRMMSLQRRIVNTYEP